jgi:hypothetical protein
MSLLADKHGEQAALSCFMAYSYQKGVAAIADSSEISNDLARDNTAPTVDLRPSSLTID